MPMGIDRRGPQAGRHSSSNLEVLEVLTTRAVAATLGGTHPDVRVQSATPAKLAVYAGLTPVGATIAALPAGPGGHFSQHAHGAAGIRGHRVVELPLRPRRLRRISTRYRRSRAGSAGPM